MRKLLITLLKIGVSAAIIGYLVYDAARGDVFANLRDQPKQWDVLAVAWACCATAVFITSVRWWYLVRALDVPCRFRDGIRISFWGYLFNLAPLGIVGGDLVKTLMLAHEHRGHRPQALASVIVDRVIGLYVLFLVATTAILVTGFWDTAQADIRRICFTTFAITAASTVGLAVMMGPEVVLRKAIKTIARIPRVGDPLERLIRAVRMYNRRPRVLLLAALSTVAVHSLFAIGCYLIACGLPGNHLSLAQHFVVMPLSAVLQVIPVPVGPTEVALEYFYRHVPVASGPAIAKGQGMVVMLSYRIITILTAALGVRYYFGNRKEMAEVMHEAEEESPKRGRS